MKKNKMHMGTMTLDREVLRAQTKSGYVIFTESEAVKESEARKQIKNSAEKLSEKTYSEIFSEIESCVKKGSDSYDHPILAHPWDEGIWANVRRFENNRPFVEGSYDWEEIKLSNLYKVSCFKDWIPGKKSTARYFDKWEKESAIVYLATRIIARKLLTAKLDVAYLKRGVNINSQHQRERNYRSSVQKIPFLKISWK